MKAAATSAQKTRPKTVKAQKPKFPKVPTHEGKTDCQRERKGRKFGHKLKRERYGGVKDRTASEIEGGRRRVGERVH